MFAKTNKKIAVLFTKNGTLLPKNKKTVCCSFAFLKTKFPVHAIVRSYHVVVGSKCGTNINQAYESTFFLECSLSGFERKDENSSERETGEIGKEKEK